MKLSAEREALLAPLQAVIGVVERRQTMPILANVLLVASDDRLDITATDLEVELVASGDLTVQEPGEITVPGRKLLDICRALPEGATVNVTQNGDRIILRSGRSRFTLSTLPASEFPVIEQINSQLDLEVEQKSLRRLLEKTHFSMAQQDVRYYLNGMLVEAEGQHLRTVATDGHRLAMSEIQLSDELGASQQVIVPRKGVLELQRLLGEQGSAAVSVGTNHIRVSLDGIRFTSKLIDGRFPEYSRVIPQNQDKHLVADRTVLRSALQRTAILSNEKYRGIRLELKENGLVVQAHNPEQEEAEEELEVEYSGEDIEIGFNVNYLLDALGAVESDEVTLSVQDSNSSCLIRQPGNDDCTFVVMPMRL